MHDETPVGELHRLTNLLEQAQTGGKIELVGRTVAGDRNALDMLHDQIRLAARRGAAIEQTRDVRMLQIGQNLPLAGKMDKSFTVGDATDQLDGDALIEVPVVALGQVDGSHAANANLMQQSPRTEHVARTQLSFSGSCIRLAL